MHHLIILDLKMSITLDVYEIKRLSRAAKLHRVVDGDTFWAEVTFDNRDPVLINCRMVGINAPEMSTDAGKLSKPALASALTLHLELEYLLKRDKYGRHLVTVFANGLNVNDWMVKQGYARVYGSVDISA
jgi:micrococcal nuclease